MTLQMLNRVKVRDIKGTAHELNVACSFLGTIHEVDGLVKSERDWCSHFSFSLVFIGVFGSPTSHNVKSVVRNWEVRVTLKSFSENPSSTFENFFSSLVTNP